MASQVLIESSLLSGTVRLCVHVRVCECAVTSVVSNTLDYSPPGSSVHGILQARILEWVAMLFSRRPSQTRVWTSVFCITGGFFTAEPPEALLINKNFSSRKWIEKRLFRWLYQKLIETEFSGQMLVFIQPGLMVGWKSILTYSLVILPPYVWSHRVVFWWVFTIWVCLYIFGSWVSYLLLSQASTSIHLFKNQF